jgi:hypothetical protein
VTSRAAQPTAAAACYRTLPSIEDLRTPSTEGSRTPSSPVEWSIYRPVRFGPAVFQHAITVDSSPRFAAAGTGRETATIDLLEPDEPCPTVTAVFRRFHERHAGSWSGRVYLTWLTASSTSRAAPDTNRRIAVHLATLRPPDGYAIYLPGPARGGAARIQSDRLWSR